MEPDGESQALIPWLLEELGDTRLLELLWDSAVWGVLGGIAGVVIGVLVFLALRAMGGYRWEWKHAGWFRGLTAFLTVAVGFAGFGTIGLCQGALKGSEAVLRKSQLATGEKGFLVIGYAGADFLAYAYIAAPIAAAAGTDPEATIPKEPFETWQKGEWELDISELFHRTESLTDVVAKQGTSKLKDSVISRFPGWKGGKLEWLLEQGLHGLGKVLVKRSIDEKLRKDPFGKIAQRLLDRLPEEAKRNGDPNTISRAELSEYFVQDGLVPLILIPLKSFVRGQQLAVLLMAFGGFLVPVVFYRVAEWIRGRRAAKAEVLAPELDDPKASDPDPATDMNG